MTDPLAIVRDYVVSSTYRKYEQLGPNFAGWRTSSLVVDPSLVDNNRSLHMSSVEGNFRGSDRYSPERRPLHAAQIDALSLECACEDILPGFADFLRGGGAPVEASAEERLMLILKLAATPLKWQPLDSTTRMQHRGIPSPGSLFSCELHIVMRRGEAAVAFRYHPHFHLLEPTGSGGVLEDLLGDNSFVFVIAGHLTYCAGYGEFSPCLVSLEAGMLQAQLAFLSSALGWTSKTETTVLGMDVRTALGLTHWTQIPLASIAITAGADGTALATKPLARTTIAKYQDPGTQFDGYPRLKALMEAVSSGGPAEPPCNARPAKAHSLDLPGHARLGDLNIADVIRRRTASAPDEMAPISGRLSRNDLLALVACTQRLHDLDPCSALGAVDLHVALSVKHADADANGGYTLNPRTGDFAEEAGAQYHGSARSSPAARERSLVATVAVDDLAEFRKQGPRAFITAHLAAGAFGQRLCLAAAALGMSARPIRAYTDALVNRALPLEQRAIYQILCCFERRANPRFNLV